MLQSIRRRAIRSWIGSSAHRRWRWWRRRSASRLLLLGPATWVGISLASGAGGALPTAGPSASLAQGGGFGGNGGDGQWPPRSAVAACANGFVPGGARSGGLDGFPPAFGEQGNGRFESRRATATAAQSLQVNQQCSPTWRRIAARPLPPRDAQLADGGAPTCIASGQPVIALGGFSGSDQILTVSQLQALVSSGAMRYFLLDGGGGGFGGQGGNGQLRELGRGELHAGLGERLRRRNIRRHTLRLLLCWLTGANPHHTLQNGPTWRMGDTIARRAGISHWLRVCLAPGWVAANPLCLNPPQS